MCRILIIDDDKDLCKLLKTNLEKGSYSVSVCNDGEARLKEAQGADYQLIILDIMLPKKNGYEVLFEIRESSHVPILMLTARDSEGDKVGKIA